MTHNTKQSSHFYYFVPQLMEVSLKVALAFFEEFCFLRTVLN